MPTILEQIMARKQVEVAAARRARPATELRAALADAPPPRDFATPLAEPGTVNLIAEIKKASPSAGIIRHDFDPVAIARIYQQQGASCLSVLTDEQYFQGHLDFLRAVRQEVDLPILRKDFILDTYQLLEARAAGADAVLLIAECLDATTLTHLHADACELGLTPLVELYEPQNLDKVLAAGATLLGVNNRNLHTFKVDLRQTLQLRQQIPRDCLLVSESGIQTPADVAQLAAAGVDAMLVGESLMRESDLAAAVRHLLGKS